MKQNKYTNINNIIINIKIVIIMIILITIIIVMIILEIIIILIIIIIRNRLIRVIEQKRKERHWESNIALLQYCNK